MHMQSVLYSDGWLTGSSLGGGFGRMQCCLVWAGRRLFGPACFEGSSGTAALFLVMEFRQKG